MRIISFKTDTGREQKVLELEISANFFLLFSGRRKDPIPAHADGPNDQLAMSYITSFLYRNEETGIAVEWEPTTGPIQIFRRGGETDKEHYAWPSIQQGSLDWSQAAVNRQSLPQAAIAVDVYYIKNILQSWSVR